MDNFEDSSPLHELLQSIVPIPRQEWAWLKSNLERKTYDAGENIFRLGDSDAGIHFIQCGLARYYYSNEEGAERNHTFASEGNLVGCFPVYAGSETCPITVQALEHTRTLYIKSEAVKQFATRHHCWAQLHMKLMAHVAMRKAAREETLLMDSPEQRYQGFLSDFKAIVSRIPQYHIASYIGVTPVALSRIRKRLNRV